MTNPRKTKLIALIKEYGLSGMAYSHIPKTLKGFSRATLLAFQEKLVVIGTEVELLDTWQSNHFCKYHIPHLIAFCDSQLNGSTPPQGSKL